MLCIRKNKEICNIRQSLVMSNFGSKETADARFQMSAPKTNCTFSEASSFDVCGHDDVIVR